MGLVTLPLPTKSAIICIEWILDTVAYSQERFRNYNIFTLPCHCFLCVGRGFLWNAYVADVQSDILGL